MDNDPFHNIFFEVGPGDFCGFRARAQDTASQHTDVSSVNSMLSENYYYGIHVEHEAFAFPPSVSDVNGPVAHFGISSPSTSEGRATDSVVSGMDLLREAGTGTGTVTMTAPGLPYQYRTTRGEEYVPDRVPIMRQHPHGDASSMAHPRPPGAPGMGQGPSYHSWLLRPQRQFRYENVASLALPSPNRYDIQNNTPHWTGTNPLPQSNPMLRHLNGPDNRLNEDMPDGMVSGDVEQMPPPQQVDNGFLERFVSLSQDREPHVVAQSRFLPPPPAQSLSSRHTIPQHPDLITNPWPQQLLQLLRQQSVHNPHSVDDAERVSMVGQQRALPVTLPPTSNGAYGVLGAAQSSSQATTNHRHPAGGNDNGHGSYVALRPSLAGGRDDPSTSRRRRGAGNNLACGPTESKALPTKHKERSCASCFLDRKKCVRDHNRTCKRCSGSAPKYPRCISSSFRDHDAFQELLSPAQRAILAGAERLRSKKGCSDAEALEEYTRRPMHLGERIDRMLKDKYGHSRVGVASFKESHSVFAVLNGVFLLVQARGLHHRAGEQAALPDDDLLVLLTMLFRRSLSMLCGKMDKNKTRNFAFAETSARSVISGVAMILEQTKAFSKTFAASCGTGKMHDLIYYLAYYLRKIIRIAFGNDTSLAGHLHIGRDVSRVSLSLSFWNVLENELRATNAANTANAANAPARDAAQPTSRRHNKDLSHSYEILCEADTQAILSMHACAVDNDMYQLSQGMHDVRLHETEPTSTRAHSTHTADVNMAGNSAYAETGFDYDADGLYDDEGPGDDRGHGGSDYAVTMPQVLSEALSCRIADTSPPPPGTPGTMWPASHTTIHRDGQAHDGSHNDMAYANSNVQNLPAHMYPQPLDVISTPGMAGMGLEDEDILDIRQTQQHNRYDYDDDDDDEWL